jgi:hypothetical protein
MTFSDDVNFSYAVPGSGRAFQLPMPRCFAVVASCPHHIATVPHVRNAGRPRVQSLVGGGSAGPGIALLCRRRAVVPCR